MTPRPDLVPLRPGYTPRPWQVDAARALRDHAKLGTQRMLLSVATGCGKGDWLAAMIVKAVWQGKRVGFMVHRDFLLSDVYERALAIEPALYAGRVVGRVNEPDRHAVFMSLQTVRTPERAAQIGRLDWLLADEAHFAMCPSGFSALSALQEINPGLRLLGATATAFRAVGNGKTTGLGPMFGPDVGGLDAPIYEYGIADGIRDGVLSPMEAKRLEPLYLRAQDDDADKRIAQLLDTDAHNDAVVEAYLRHRAPGIAFCASVPHAIHLAERFRRAGVKAEAVWDSSSSIDSATGQRIGRDQDRDRKIAAIHEVVTNLDLLSTGFDCRRLEVMMSVRPTGSPGLFAQQVGRVTRLSPETGKARGLVLDFVDNTVLHNLAFEADLSTPDAKVRTVEMGDVVRHRYAVERAEGLVTRTEEDGRRGFVEWRGHPGDWHPATELVLVRKRREREAVSVVPAIRGLREYVVELVRGDASAGWYAYTPSSGGKTWTVQARVSPDDRTTALRLHVRQGQDGYELWRIAREQDASGRLIDWPLQFSGGHASAEEACEVAARIVREEGWQFQPVHADWKLKPSTESQHRSLRHYGKRANLEALTQGEASALIAALSSIEAITDLLDPQKAANRARARDRYRRQRIGERYSEPGAAK
jgi:superfamily II DNA or RNA helicase